MPSGALVPRESTPYQTQEAILEDDINEELLSPQDIRNQEAEVQKYVKHERAWIPFGKILTDEGMVMGQSRELDTGRVAKYVRDVIANPKRGPLEDLLAIPTAQRGVHVVRDFAYQLLRACNSLSKCFST
jgi:hypothetical protein